MKNTEKNNAQPPLLDLDKNANPIKSQFVTAAQISELIPFAEIDDTFLRNRAAAKNQRTGAPWIPRPIDTKYELTPTILGLLEWFHARSADKDGLPTTYDSMQAMENATKLPRKSIKWVIKNGAESAQHPGSRIDPRPIFERIGEIISALADGSITGIDGLEEWNESTERAKKLRLETEKLEDEKLLRRGEMLMSKDGTFAIEELVADELIWEKRDQPLRAALIGVPKVINRQLRTILNSADATPDKIRKATDVVQNAISDLLKKMRQKIPNRLTEEAAAEK